MVATVNLKPSPCCDRWQFYRGWLPGRLLAVYTVGSSKFNPTAKNRLSYCKKAGYISTHEPWEQWNLHRQDVFEINTSAKDRQGRPMNPAYFVYPAEKTIDNPCKDHQYHLISVSYGGKWLAYSIVHAMGELMNISTIIGHADRLRDGIMLLLMEEIVKVASERGVKYIDYNEWESGTPGLKYWKHSTGFAPMELKEL